MASPDDSSLKRLQMQVCDNCRFRKTRCDRGLPCNSCIASSICCQYLHTPRRKGPRGGKGRRLLQIRQGLSQFDKDHVEINTLSQVQADMAADAELEGSPPLPEAAIDGSHLSLTSSKQSKHQAVAALTTTIQCFMKRLLPIMPVVDEAEIQPDVDRFHDLSLPRQCFLLALCAATRVQLKLDYVKERDGTDAPVNTYLHSPLTGKGLLEAARRLRRQFDIVDNIGLEAILTSFFLFAAHGNLEQQHHASFCLNEAITMAISLGLDNEDTYVGLAKKERELRRRIFWLLFVTERTYALQRRRPVMLRSTISKPQIIDSDCPALMHDFVNHIRLFEMLPHTLYDWLPTSDPLQQQSSAVTLSQRVSDMLCMVQPGDSVLESQRFDTLVTQQWLRVSMWRLSFGRNLRQMRYHGYHGYHGESSNLGVPFDAGRSIMSHLALVRQASKDCHGIAIEQKLFDIGISLTDASVAVNPASSFEFGPVDLLYSIVKCLGHIRGCKSPLLPQLLNHCGGLLPSVAPAPQLNMLSVSYEASSAMHADAVSAVMDCETSQAEESCADGLWNQENCGNSQFDDMTPFLPLTCEALAYTGTAPEG